MNTNVWLQALHKTATQVNKNEITKIKKQIALKSDHFYIFYNHSTCIVIFFLKQNIGNSAQAVQFVLSGGQVPSNNTCFKMYCDSNVFVLFSFWFLRVFFVISNSSSRMDSRNSGRCRNRNGNK